MSKRAVCAWVLLLMAIAPLTVAEPWKLQRDKGGRWWFISPKGQKFWSFGADCVGEGTPWERWNPKNKSYSAHRLFDNAQAWVDHVLSDLASMGFNSIGGWSDTALFQKYGGKRRLPYFEVLHLGSYNKLPWNDVFSKETETLMRQAAADQVPKLRDDPFLVGYFTDNELGWWDDSLFMAYLSLPEKSPGRERLIGLFEKRYAKVMARLGKDWITKAKTWSEFKKNPVAKLRPGGNGIELVHEWTYVLCDKYYGLAKKAIRAYDKYKPILGDRYIQYYTFESAAASRKYVDAVSTNNGADWNDGTYARYFLDTLHKVTGKPVIVGEFYIAANQNRSGNKNTGTWFPKVETQVERAADFKNCIEFFASRPFVVGAHWFQYSDEPEHGRDDGEDWNMGLVDIEGAVYKEMAVAAKSVDTAKVHASAKPLPICTDIPPAPKGMSLSKSASLRDWDRVNGFVPVRSGDAFGDLYVCADADNVYFGLYAMDYMDEKLYEGNKVPESERSQFTVSCDGELEFSVRYGGKGRAAKSNDSRIAVFEIPELRHTLICRVPRRLLRGSAKLKIAAKALAHSRGRRMVWSAEVSLR